MKPIAYILCLIFLTFLVTAAERTWKPLGNDEVHDPKNPALNLLQEPSQALSLLPPDSVGNKVSWIRALRETYIEPRTNIFPETEIKVIDMEIIMERTGEMPLVLFPHKPHTEWLDCKNCHNKIFIDKVGANPVNMMSILSGEFCGRCHGAVAFPLTECNRCHSVNRSTFAGKPGVQPEKTTTDG